MRRALSAQRVLDEARDDAAPEFVNHTRAFERAVGRFDFAQKAVDERRGGAQVGEFEQTGAQTVVDVVRVIGDIVGDRRGLRFGAGV